MFMHLQLYGNEWTGVCTIHDNFMYLRTASTLHMCSALALYPLLSCSDITDHCRLLLVDTPTDHAPSPESDINMPFNFDASTLDSQSTQRSQCSTPGSYQGSPNEDNQATPRTELDAIMR